MKTLLTIGLALYAGCALAANPTFQSFNTNHFVANAAGNIVRANTNVDNPNALVAQSQLGGISGITQHQFTLGLQAGTNIFRGYVSNSAMGDLLYWSSNSNITSQVTGNPGLTLFTWQMNLSNIFYVNGPFFANSISSVGDITAGGQFKGSGAGLSNITASSVTGLLSVTNVTANTYAAFDNNGALTSTVDGSNWTHLVTSPAATDTNIVAQKSTGALIFLSLSNLYWSIAHGQTNLSAGSISATNTGGTNILGGYNWFTNNTAPVVPITPVGTGGQFYTNNLGTRAMLCIPYYIQDAVTGVPIGTISNRMTGKKFTISFGALAMTATNMFLCPPCSPNDVWDIRNESTGGGVTFGYPSVGPVAEWYPVN